MSDNDREVRSVWRCAIRDVCGVLDMAARKLEASRRKHERQEGVRLRALSDLIWTIRSPAPSNYAEANEAGKRLNTLVRHHLENSDEG